MRSHRMTIALAAMLIAATVVPGLASAEDPRHLGRWSAPFWEGGTKPYDPPSHDNTHEFPTAAHLVALPDGRMLYWNALEGDDDSDLFIGRFDGTLALSNSRARVMQLGDQPSWSIPSPERGRTEDARDWNDGKGMTHDMFCGNQVLLYDGTALIVGGTEARMDMFADPIGSDAYGDTESTIFDARLGASGEFRPVGDMRNERWYPSLVTLADGEVMAVSGVRRILQSFQDVQPSFSQVRETEIYDPRTRRWRVAGEDAWSMPLYPRLHLLPDGTVYYGAAGQTWSPFGETADEAAWALQRIYDPATQTWRVVGPARYGVRGGATSTLLRLEPPYTRADILVSGGTLAAPAPGSYVGTTLSEVIRWENGSIKPVTPPKSPLAGLAGDRAQLSQQRWVGVSVLLPTGEVMLVNGGDVEDTLVPGSTKAVRVPELYDPKTGTWRRLAAGARDRTWHSSAVLLPDGRVLVGGHAPEPAYFRAHDNTGTRANNFRDSTFEIYEPPYLHRGDRPVIESMTIAADGRSLRIAATDADEVVLVRLGATTHGVDGDARAVVLEHTENPDGTVTAKLPAEHGGRVVPPGPYYVFVNSDTPDGAVPSVARTVLVRPDVTSGSVVFGSW